MSVECLRTEKFAHYKASIVPVRPIRVIYNNGFQALENFLFGLKGVGNAQTKLAAAVAGGILLKTKAGIKATIVYWDGSDGVVAGFDANGNQIGFGQAVWDPDPKKREASSRFMTYRTAYVVAPSHEQQGIASAMMMLLEEHAAANNRGIGASFFYDVQAETPVRQAAAQRLIDKTGAAPMGDNIHYMRALLKPDYFRQGHQQPGIVYLPSSEIKISSSY